MCLLRCTRPSTLCKLRLEDYSTLLAVISMTDWLIEQSIFDLTERSNKHKHKHKHKEIEKIWFDIFIPTKQTTMLRLSQVSWLLRVFVHPKVTCELIFIWFYNIDIVVMSQWYTINTLPICVTAIYEAKYCWSLQTFF